MNEDKPTAPEVEEFDADSIQTTTNIVDMHQEGNWLHGLTDTGIRFRQHIKQGKRLNKREGRFVIEDVEIAQGSPKSPPTRH